MITVMITRKEERQPITGMMAKIIEYRFKCVHCSAIHIISTFDKMTFRSHDKLQACGRRGCMHYLPDVERMLMDVRRRLRYTSHIMEREPAAP